MHHGSHRLAGLLEAAANAVILLGTLADLFRCRVGDTVLNQLLPRSFTDVAVWVVGGPDPGRSNRIANALGQLHRTLDQVHAFLHGLFIRLVEALVGVGRVAVKANQVTRTLRVTHHDRAFTHRATRVAVVRIVQRHSIQGTRREGTRAGTVGTGDADAGRLALDLALILDIADQQPIGEQQVFVGRGFTGNHRTLQGGVFGHVDGVATLTGKEPALVGNRLVVAVHFRRRQVHGRGYRGAITDRRNADARTEARAVLLALGRFGVLARQDVEVAADVGIDTVSAYLRADQAGVLAAAQHQRAGVQRGVNLGDGAARTQVLGGLRAQVDGEAVLLADVEAGTDSGPVARAVVFAVGGVLRALHQDVVFRGQQRAVGFQRTAGNRQVTHSARRIARSDD